MMNSLKSIKISTGRRQLRWLRLSNEIVRHVGAGSAEEREGRERLAGNGLGKKLIADTWPVAAQSGRKKAVRTSTANESNVAHVYCFVPPLRRIVYTRPNHYAF